MEPRYREDTDLMPELAAAQIRKPHKVATWGMFSIAFGLLIFILWASITDLPEVTKGEGTVIPSRQNQIVQHVSGGIVRAILVKEGDVVKSGQVLLRIQNQNARAEYDEKRVEYLSLAARAARLSAEARGISKITFPAAVKKEIPAFARQQEKVFRARLRQQKAELGVLEQQETQRQQILREQYSLVSSLSKRVASLSREVRRARAGRRDNSVSRLEFLRLQRQLSDAQGDLRTERLKIPRYTSGIQEAKQKIADKKNEIRSKVLKELSEVRSKIAEMEELLRKLYFNIGRTDVRSPVRGTIKQLRVSTRGGVVKAGEPLVEIVPLEDTLLIEAKIRPSDRAFLRIGQKAVVKITAYDYTVYGGLEGKVVSVSADTIEDNNRAGEAFYKVRVRTTRGYLESSGKQLPIIPGMTAVVNILTGKEKSVLDYILKPITKSQQSQAAGR